MTKMWFVNAGPTYSHRKLKTSLSYSLKKALDVAKVLQEEYSYGYVCEVEYTDFGFGEEIIIFEWKEN